MPLMGRIPAIGQVLRLATSVTRYSHVVTSRKDKGSGFSLGGSESAMRFVVFQNLIVWVVSSVDR